jgi:hypothetical protein
MLDKPSPRGRRSTWTMKNLKLVLAIAVSWSLAGFNVPAGSSQSQPVPATPAPATTAQWNAVIGTLRGKAIMSYACNKQNNNVFFEPVDVQAVRAPFAPLSTAGFVPLTSMLAALRRRSHSAARRAALTAAAACRLPGLRMMQTATR